MPLTQFPLPPLHVCCDGTCQVLSRISICLPYPGIHESRWGPAPLNANSLHPGAFYACGLSGLYTDFVCPCPLSSSVPAPLFVDDVLSLSFQSLSHLPTPPGPCPTLHFPMSLGAVLSQQARSALNLLISLSPSFILPFIGFLEPTISPIPSKTGFYFYEFMKDHSFPSTSLGLCRGWLTQDPAQAIAFSWDPVPFSLSDLWPSRLGKGGEETHCEGWF